MKTIQKPGIFAARSDRLTLKTCFIILPLLLLFGQLWSQTHHQQRRWFLNAKDVNYNNVPPTVTGISNVDLYNSTEQLATNGVHNQNNTRIFNINGPKLYAEGLPANAGIPLFSMLANEYIGSEVTIFPKPGSCDSFFIFYGHRHYTTSAGCTSYELRYTLVDRNRLVLPDPDYALVEKEVSLFNKSFSASDHYCPPAVPLAASKEKLLNGVKTRQLFFIDYDLISNDRKFSLRRVDITYNSISISDPLFTHNDYQFDLHTYELELSPDGSKLALGRHRNSYYTGTFTRYPKKDIVMYHLNSNGTLNTALGSSGVTYIDIPHDTLYQESVVGLEFNAASDRLFASVANDRIYYISDLTSPNPGINPMNELQTRPFTFSQMELVYNNGIEYISVAKNQSEVHVISGVNVPTIPTISSSPLFSNANVPEDRYAYPIDAKGSELNPPRRYILCLPDQVDGDKYGKDGWFNPSNSFRCCMDYYIGTGVNNHTVQASATWSPGSNPPGSDPFNPNEAVFDGTLTINPGVTLTLQGGIILRFRPGAKMVIHPNARVVLNGATLSGLACGLMWEGVEVWGNAAQHQYVYGSNQYHQGFLEIKNASVIENAHNAIKLGKTGDALMQNTGGIVQASGNSIFKNNKRDVEFLKYQNFLGLPTQKRGNVSYFRNCRFETTANLGDGSNPNSHITMWNVDGVRIVGCTFENSNPNVTSNSALGNGIYTEDAHFLVSDCDFVGLCLPPACCSLAPNTFKNLNNGIWAKKVSGVQNYSVDKTNFINCVTNINNEGVNNAIITRNNFTIGKPKVNDPLTLWTTAINFNTGTNYRIEENVIVKDAAAYPKTTIGTWMMNTGMINNQVYKNNFTNLTLANYAHLDNRGYNPVTLQEDGLAYLCNTHTNNTAFDIVINGNNPSNDGIRFLQGKLNANGTSVVASAGNIFTRPNTSSQSDIQNLNTPSIIYYYDGAANSSNPKYPFYSTPIPKVYTASTTANSCPSNFGGSGKNYEITATVINTGKLSAAAKQELVAKFDAHNQSLGQAKNLYRSLLDGGNTNQLKSEVENANQNETWQLRQNLLGKSPYLSKTVLKESADKTNVLPEAVLFEVLSANPDGLKDEELIRHLSEKANPLPEWMIELLRAGSDQTTSRTILEATIVHTKAERDLIASFLVQDILTMRAEDEDMDHQELRSWLATYESPHGDYQIVDDFFETGDYHSGLSLLSTIPGTYKLNEKDRKEFADMKSLFHILSDMNSSGRNIYTLSEKEMEAVKDLADNGEGIARVRACNLVSFVTGIECNYDLQLPDMTKQSFKSETQIPVKNNPLLPTINVFPNPAKDYVEFSYNLPAGVMEGTLTITDLKGAVIHQQQVSNNYGQVAVDSREWQQGTYLYSLTANGHAVSKQKFVLFK